MNRAQNNASMTEYVTLGITHICKNLSNVSAFDAFCDDAGWNSLSLVWKTNTGMSFFDWLKTEIRHQVPLRCQPQKSLLSLNMMMAYDQYVVL
jgi:hypothetical protein